ncbi:hypothetical protein [Ancylobacter sp. IITR112]|uniref:hypothetical protein n=1 Tax=Ancylobacter sp. IITR112 TaxID=3138073 RepID=UPI00352A85CE
MTGITKTSKLVALALAGTTLLAAVPAAADGWRGPGWGGPGPGYGWGRPGPGWRGPGWRAPGYYYAPRRNNNGAAIAAGIIGGLAVGAIAAGAANNYYRPSCWMETRTLYNSWGQPYYRDVEVCR